MGCDISAHIEIFVNGEWHHYSNPVIQRDYRLFGKLAGVRDLTVNPISPPRGLPDDITLVTKIDYDARLNTAYCESWISEEEIGSVVEFYLQKKTVRDMVIDGMQSVAYVFHWTHRSTCVEKRFGIEKTRKPFWFEG